MISNATSNDPRAEALDFVAKNHTGILDGVRELLADKRFLLIGSEWAESYGQPALHSRVKEELLNNCEELRKAGVGHLLLVLPSDRPAVSSLDQQLIGAFEMAGMKTDVILAQANPSFSRSVINQRAEELLGALGAVPAGEKALVLTFAEDLPRNAIRSVWEDDTRSLASRLNDAIPGQAASVMLVSEEIGNHPFLTVASGFRNSRGAPDSLLMTPLPDPYNDPMLVDPMISDVDRYLF